MIKNEFISKSEILVILGNGFDLAFGLKSSYSSFFNSHYWPFPRKVKRKNRIRTASYLDRFLNDKMQDNWYNLESLLAEYGEMLYEAKKEVINSYFENSSVDEERLKADKECFNRLKKGMKNFISSAKKIKKPENSNPAVKFLHAISMYTEPIIYSFNYTDLSEFAEMVGITNLKCIHVHGSLKGPEEIVLGVQDNTKLPDGYDFLRKVSEPTYRSTNIFYDLMRAKEVVFFGHSLGENDYHFFSRFFQIHSEDYSNDPNNRCRITFFTANEQSRIDILKNLRLMNDGKNDQLFALNNLKFIRTVDSSPQALKDLEDWIDDLRIRNTQTIFN